jgi:predicted dehydrogenase
MASPKPLNIGMIGYGFMGRAHSNGYRKVSNFFELPYRPVLKAACARDAAKAKAFAETWGYESVETDWRKLVERKDIDAIDICVPNNLHKEIALAAAANKKMILCEKPLSMNTAEGEEMCKAVEKAGVANTVWYNYRRVPVVCFCNLIIYSVIIVCVLQ